MYGIYYKFTTNREINNRVLRDCPPNDQQRRICDRMAVPASLWSFYLFKKEIIYESLVTRRFFPGHFRERWFFDEESIENYDYSGYRDMNLTPEEKFFIFYRRDIDRYRRDCFCFDDSLPSLQTLCLRRISDLEDPIDGLSSLPKMLISRIEIERELWKRSVSMPKYDPTRMKTLFFDVPLNDLFSEFDTRNFPKEFVIWFQNDPIVHERFRPDCPVRFIYCHFERMRSFSSIKYNFCLRCMKRCWDLQYGKKLALKRRYYLHDVSFTDQLNKIRLPCHWCARCKRVPLFKILSSEEYVKQHGDGWTSEEEIFL